MKDLIVDAEFQKLIPPITKKEYTDLEDSVRGEGCRDALVTWNDTLLDGHNRYKICKMFNIPFRTKPIEMHDKDDAKLWIVKNQLARRNLTPEQMKYLRGKRHDIEKKSVGERGKKIGQNDPSLNTAERLAKEYGVSASTIKRDAKFAEKVDLLPEEEKEQVLSGEKKIDELFEEARKAPMVEMADKISIAVEAMRNEPEPKDSTVLMQLKFYWKKACKADKKRFSKWAGLTINGGN